MAVVLEGSVPGTNTPRVLHVNSLLNGGGTDDQCVQLVRALSRSGLDVRLAGPAGRRYSQFAQAAGVLLDPLPPSKRGFILGLARLLRRGRIDIVHAHHGRDYWPTVLAARLSGMSPKVVLTRHMAKSPSSWVSRHLLLSQCDAVVAVSEFVARVMREGAFEPGSSNPERQRRLPLRGDHSKIEVIGNAVDTERFRPFEASGLRRAWGLGPSDFAFGVVGSYELPHGKGQREFLEAAASIRSAVPQARFVIIGRGNMETVLQADMTRLGLAASAQLVPYTDDVPTVMNALDCLVHPQTGTEAFATVVLEAFACGKPVIASRLDGIPEAFAAGNYGQLIAPGSIAELAAAMLMRAREPALTQAKREALHARIAASFSAEHLAKDMLSCYYRLQHLPEPASAELESLVADTMAVPAVLVPAPTSTAPLQ